VPATAVNQPLPSQGLWRTANLQGDCGMVAHQPLVNDLVVAANAVGNGAHLQAAPSCFAKASIALVGHGGNNSVRT